MAIEGVAVVGFRRSHSRDHALTALGQLAAEPQGDGLLLRCARVEGVHEHIRVDEALQSGTPPRWWSSSCVQRRPPESPPAFSARASSSSNQAVVGGRTD